jgi:hypothetical protein
LSERRSARACRPASHAGARTAARWTSGAAPIRLIQARRAWAKAVITGPVFDNSQQRGLRHSYDDECRRIFAMTRPEPTDIGSAEPALSISPDKVFYIIAKAREFDVKDVVTDPDPASNAADDAMISVLEDHSDDPVFDELSGFIKALHQDEQIDLVSLAWFGREDNDLEDWEEIRSQAQQAHNNHTASYLLGMPLLGDHLEEAMSQLGYSHEDYELGGRR